MTTKSSPAAPLDAIIIGSGFGGLGMAIEPLTRPLHHLGSVLAQGGLASPPQNPEYWHLNAHNGPDLV